ncbi:hypothetical protein LIN78_05350 [Leeia sp. TBRC 13508]|uniref:Uncharacterized protein n=1 Tax=Leeia speluncae TaxID=2884804 RepID=A0ABS8D5S2_9NEIS|nr:hypothetical protein [Leeia speluncae]MCB6182973.1 hypothetical protein [Leeia speluncae]
MSSNTITAIDNLPCMTLANVMNMLWDKSKSSLSYEETKWFSNAVYEAERLFANQMSTIEGLACLVADDHNTGSFQDKQSVSSLLFSIAQTMEAGKTLLDVSLAAQFQLDAMECARNRGKIGGNHE